ncbi:MAG: hypothetical protein LV479_03220 [Methylacidiphilales bacterium]|nr:hypothetical protein [Candidatus Methylacidiphilales bacterium]
MPNNDAALLLLGHGSTLNSDSSVPTYEHAEEIRRRGMFTEVHVAFWKEETNFRQALHLTDCRQIYVVPDFISSGYFTEQIIPRELGLEGPITRREGREIFYCEPVGLHPSMTEALLRRASEVVAASGERIAEPAKTACLFICGHGTSLNDNSTRIIHEQAGLIRSRGLYADCQAVLMEQRPLVKDWRTLTNCPDVIVVPFFISDGLHSFENIPVLLGLTHDVREKFFANPHHENGRRLWYASAIGTEPFLADVILAQVHQFQQRYADAVAESPGTPIAPSGHKELEQFLQDTPPPFKIGEMVIHKREDGSFELRHGGDLDRDSAGLHRIESLEELRDLVRFDSDGNFRPLHAAPHLRSGWIYCAGDLAALHLALDYIYPAALANGMLHRNGRLPVTSWKETAERQSGRFHVVREINDASLHDVVRDICERKCRKRRLWSPAAQPVEPQPGEISLLCPEACNLLVSKVRDKLEHFKIYCT